MFLLFCISVYVCEEKCKYYAESNFLFVSQLYEKINRYVGIIFPRHVVLEKPLRSYGQVFHSNPNRHRRTTFCYFSRTNRKLQVFRSDADKFTHKHENEKIRNKTKRSYTLVAETNFRIISAIDQKPSKQTSTAVTIIIRN